MKRENIWERLPKHFLALAPMEGVTDVVFRQVVARAGRPDLFFTEFTNVSSYASEKGRANALERLDVVPTDRPIIAQIWGKEPEHFEMVAGALAGLGFDGVDINMGCPDRHVVKAGGGAAMIRTPTLACECIAKARRATSLPVSVKTRLGYSDPGEWRGWLQLLLEQRPAALTIHLRTKKEMSKVPAHYELIPDIMILRAQVSPETKLVVNGDIRDYIHAAQLVEQYPEIDGLMIGRGVFANPFCFAKENGPSFNYSTDCSKSQDVNAILRERLFDLLYYHLDLHDHRATELAERGSRYPFEPLKHFFKVYINNFPGASELRARLMECHTTDEVRATLQQENA